MLHEERGHLTDGQKSGKRKLLKLIALGACRFYSFALANKESHRLKDTQAKVPACLVVFLPGLVFLALATKRQASCYDVGAH